MCVKSAITPVHLSFYLLLFKMFTIKIYDELEMWYEIKKINHKQLYKKSYEDSVFNKKNRNSGN